MEGEIPNIKNVIMSMNKTEYQHHLDACFKGFDWQINCDCEKSLDGYREDSQKFVRTFANCLKSCVRIYAITWFPKGQLIYMHMLYDTLGTNKQTYMLGERYPITLVNSEVVKVSELVKMAQKKLIWEAERLMKER